LVFDVDLEAELDLARLLPHPLLERQRMWRPGAQRPGFAEENAVGAVASPMG
jgi:hypothetical protein